MTGDVSFIMKDCTFDSGPRSAGFQIEPLKGLHELASAGIHITGCDFRTNRVAPPKFDPRAPLTPLAAKLLAVGMAKMQAGR